MRFTPTGLHNKAWGRRLDGAPQESCPIANEPQRVPHYGHVRVWLIIEPVGVRIPRLVQPGVRRFAATPGYAVEPVPGKNALWRCEFNSASVLA